MDAGVDSLGVPKADFPGGANEKVGAAGVEEGAVGAGVDSLEAPKGEFPEAPNPPNAGVLVDAGAAVDSFGAPNGDLSAGPVEGAGVDSLGVPSVD